MNQGVVYDDYDEFTPLGEKELSSTSWVL